MPRASCTRRPGDTAVAASAAPTSTPCSIVIFGLASVLQAASYSAFGVRTTWG